MRFEKENPLDMNILDGDTVFVKNHENRYLNEDAQFDDFKSGNEWVILKKK